MAMSTRRWCALLTVLSLGVAGCTESAQVDESPSPVQTEEPASESPDSSEVDETTEPPSGDATDAPSSDPDPDWDEPRDYGERVTSERGAVIKDLGQWSGMGALDGSAVWADFRIVDIEPNFTCTNPDALESLNGNFIAISIEAETYPELAGSNNPQFWITARELRILGADGVRENDSIGNGSECLAAQDRFPDVMGPGERARGKVVLDSAQTGGTLILAYPTLSGWEWQF